MKRITVLTDQAKLSALSCTFTIMHGKTLFFALGEWGRSGAQRPNPALAVIAFTASGCSSLGSSQRAQRSNDPPNPIHTKVTASTLVTLLLAMAETGFRNEAHVLASWHPTKGQSYLLFHLENRSFNLLAVEGRRDLMELEPRSGIRRIACRRDPSVPGPAGSLHVFSSNGQ